MPSRGANDGRELAVRVEVGAGFAPSPLGPDIDCLDVREAGTGGGPIEVRLPLTLGRGFAVVIDATRPLDGVPVLGVDVADVAPDASCFVGDLVGDFVQN